MVFEREDESLQGLFPIASWKVGTSALIAFPVTDISESGGNRIVERERPYRDGAKLDDTGSKAKRWNLTAVFENTLDEPGLEVNSDVLYPDMLDELLDSFDNHETGDLVVPTRGTIRAKAESYTRTESKDEVDCAILQLVFVQDNEDNVDAASFTLMTANSNSTRLGEVTEFDAQTDEMWSDGLVSIREFSQQLEDISNKPGEVSDDVDNSASRVINASRTTERAFSNAGNPGRDKLLNPESSKTYRKLVMNQDVAARAKHESRKGRPQIITVVSNTKQTLYSIASFYAQPFSDLLAINPKLENPNFIPRGTGVNIFYVPAS